MNDSDGASKAEDERLSVVMLTGQFIPEVFGGAEQQCARLCSALAGRGVEITVLTSRNSLAFPKEKQDGGFEVIRFFTIWNPQIMGKYILASLIWFTQVFIWFLRNHDKVDVVHAHQYKFPAYVGAVICRLYDLPLVVKPGNAGEHSDFASLSGKAFIGRHLCRVARRQVTRFVAISQEIADEILKRGIERERVVKIYNGVQQPIARENLLHVRAESRNKVAPDLASDVRVIAFVGRLEPVKNLDCLLRALATLNPSVSGARWQLWMIGTGSQESVLKELAVSLGLSDCVRFLGYQPEVTLLLQASDFLVLASVAEGMSNALLEAMAVGTIPISTPVSGSIDLIVNNERGFLADGFSVEAVAESIGRALQLSRIERNIVMERCFYHIADECEIGHVADRYVSIYQRITT